VTRIDRLTMAEAEAFIATLWRALEEYQIPSPRLKVYGTSAGVVDLAFTFRSAQDAELIKRLMPFTSVEAGRRSAPEPAVTEMRRHGGPRR
jgi:hypothetical protein